MIYFTLDNLFVYKKKNDFKFKNNKIDKLKQPTCLINLNKLKLHLAFFSFFFTF